jgi:hypothetical protein
MAVTGCPVNRKISLGWLKIGYRYWELRPRYEASHHGGYGTENLTTATDTVLTMAISSDRTAAVTANYKAAFETLLAKMWFIKSRYFLTPPITEADSIALELKPRDTTHSPVHPPLT